MPIRENALRHWLRNFYGYGSWDAAVWFIPYEEGGGELPEEVAEKLSYFGNCHAPDTPALCDIRELYRHVTVPGSATFSTLYDYRFGARAALHGSWKNLIAFTHGYQNKDLPDLLEYQKNYFASESEALIPLYPLPSPHNHAWYYSWLEFPDAVFLKTRKSYEEHVYERRIQQIFDNIRTHRPTIVVMVGMNQIQTLKRSAQAFFPEATFTMAKAVKRLLPQYHKADLNGTTLVITTQIPALRHNRIETGFDWQAFGKIVSTI